MQIQENDRKILRELQKDATLSLKALAEMLNMSQSTVWRRIQDLEAEGVITGRVTLVDPVKAGLEVCSLIHVNIVEHKAHVREAFEEFVDGHDTVLQCFVVTGAHDYTLIIRTHTVEEYEHFLMNELLTHPSVASTVTLLALRQQKNTTRLPI